MANQSGQPEWPTRVANQSGQPEWPTQLGLPENKSASVIHIPSKGTTSPAFVVTNNVKPMLVSLASLPLYLSHLSHSPSPISLPISPTLPLPSRAEHGDAGAGACAAAASADRVHWLMVNWEHVLGCVGKDLVIWGWSKGAELVLGTAQKMMSTRGKLWRGKPWRGNHN